MLKWDEMGKSHIPEGLVTCTKKEEGMAAEKRSTR